MTSGSPSRGLSEWQILAEPDIGVRQGYIGRDQNSTGYSTAPGFRGIKAQNELHHRYLTEDVGYSMVFLTDLARHLAVPTPTMDAVIHIASIVAGEDFAAERARTMDNIGSVRADAGTARGILTRAAHGSERPGWDAGDDGPMVRLLADLGRPALGAHSIDISVLDEAGQMLRLVTSRRSAPRARIRLATSPAFDPEQVELFASHDHRPVQRCSGRHDPGSSSCWWSKFGSDGSISWGVLMSGVRARGRLGEPALARCTRRRRWPSH